MKDTFPVNQIFIVLKMFWIWVPSISYIQE